MKIPQSRIKTMPAFEARVAAFIQAKNDHLTTEGVPAPTEDPLVEQSVRRVHVAGALDDYVADYEIVNDAQPPTLVPTDTQRDAWAKQAQAMENAKAAGSIVK